jgi:hypothetical protein
MEPKVYLDELKLALQEYRLNDVKVLNDQIDPNAFDTTQIKKALNLIRRKRMFSELERVSTIFHMAGKLEPVIKRQWSQALLDQNRISQALATLKSMSEKFSSDPVEGPEIRGLIGRAYKQLYVNEGDAENLRAGISSYLPDWEGRSGDYRWQGINLVALLTRAKHDGVDSGISLDVHQIAHEILNDIEERGAFGIWDYATAMEAEIALNNKKEAIEWAKKYVLHPDTDAFELASTIRQLKEVWSLEGNDLGETLLPVLECALLQREGGSVSPVKSGKIHDKSGFEAVWGSEAYVYLQWIDTLYHCCNAVARVSDSASGAPNGTGFLVNGSHLNPSWGDAPVFLTNAHVISMYPADEAPLHPEEAQAEFTRCSGKPKVGFGELLFSSPRTELDVSILRVNAPNDSQTLEPYPYLPNVSKDPTEPQRIYVVGHPGGTELAVSLYDNNLEEIVEQYVRYRSPTENGHSGSPVLTRQLKVFAIHHRAIYERQLNEGIILNAIKAALNDS